MISLDQITNTLNTPLGIGIFAGFVTMFYLVLMSINSYLPPVLLMSLTIGYIVYYVQKNCQQCQLVQQINMPTKVHVPIPQKQPTQAQVAQIHALPSEMPEEFQ